MAEPTLYPITVYLSEREVAALNGEAKAEGRSGVSAQVRWVLSQRRKDEASG